LLQHRRKFVFFAVAALNAGRLLADGELQHSAAKTFADTKPVARYVRFGSRVDGALARTF
jgi:hypothetical protein